MDIVEFVRARLDEDEAVAQAAEPSPWRWADPGYAYGKGIKYGLLAGEGNLNRVVLLAAASDAWPSKYNAAQIVHWQPARALREVESKRLIVDGLCTARGLVSLVAVYGTTDPEQWILRLLALPYADHPDYRQEWKP